MERDSKFMSMALKQAEKASSIDEVPVGCVIVLNNKVIARSYNLREHKNDVSGHAEMIAIKKASKKIQDWQLVDCEVYVTLEPCIMCAGALLQSRVKRIVFGAYDFKGGAFGSSINVLEAKNINHKPEIVPGILQEKCSTILKNYFKNKR